MTKKGHPPETTEESAAQPEPPVPEQDEFSEQRTEEKVKARVQGARFLRIVF
jgi:hypothetical protein